MLPTNFRDNWPFNSETKNNFQDGHSGDHLGFPIGKLLAISSPISRLDVSYQVLEATDLFTQGKN